MSGFKKNLPKPYLAQVLQSTSDRAKLTGTWQMDSFYNNAMASITDGQFDAYCLSGIRTEDNTGAGTDTNDAYLDPFGYLWIIAYPDIRISKPGDPRAFSTPEEIIESIGSFKSSGFWVRSNYLANGKAAPTFGQKLNMYFEEGSIANSDWSKARFTDPEGIPDYGDGSFRRLASIKGLATAQGAFENGVPMLLGNQQPIAKSTNEEINALALRFDTEKSSYKARNKGLIARAHPEFQNYIKAFITLSKDNDVTIYLNSTHRNRAQQDKLIAEHARGDRKIKPAEYSYHLVGLAFDFNPILKNGDWVKSTASKQQWIKTGIVAIGESLGLRWGGHFSTNYDPVHFDLGKKVSSTRMSDMVAAAKEKGVEGTQIPTGQKV